MEFDRDPDTASRDTHRLVVVPGRPTGRERVAQPVAVLGRHRVGEVRERRGALVRCDDHVRIVLVMAHDVGRGDDAVRDAVVSQVEQRGDEHAVARNPFGLRCGPVGRRPLDHKTTLRAHRYDHRVLDHLGLGQVEHLGAQILAAVGPPEAAAADRSEAQVHGVHPGRRHPDLVTWTRTRQLGNRPGIELERKHRSRAPVPVALVVVGADRGDDHSQDRAQDPIMVEALHLLESTPDRHDQFAFGHHAITRYRRVEPHREQLQQQPRHRHVGDEAILDVLLTERGTGLAQVLAVRTHDRCLTPRAAGQGNERVEPIRLGVAVPHRDDRLLNQAPWRFALQVPRRRISDAEVVDPDARPLVPSDLVGALVDDVDAHPLQDRQDLRERHRRTVPIDLEAAFIGPRWMRLRQPHRDAVVDTRLEPIDVIDRDSSGDVHLVCLGEGIAVRH